MEPVTTEIATGWQTKN